jgi:putative hemolysin
MGCGNALNFKSHFEISIMSAISEILFVLLLLFANGLFSMSEMAVVSARKARLKQFANEGDARAQAALELAENPSVFLSTVQIGITLVGIMAGAFGGATIAEELSLYLKRFPAIEPYADQIGLAIVVAAITYLSLVIGELIPKRIALHSPERIASLSAAPMKMLSKAAAPVVRLLEISTGGLLRLFGLRESQEPPVTEDEIKVLVEQGISAGVFQEEERDLIERTFHLGDRFVSELMVPRTEIIWLDLDDSFEENKEKISRKHFSRFPVIQGSPDNILGTVRAKDLLARTLDNQPFDLRAALLPPIYFPDSMPAFKAIENFKKHRRHMALVIDEHGGVEGLVTVNDILDALVGDIPSMDEPHEQAAVQREDGSWLFDGGLSIVELKKILKLKQIPGEAEGNFQTLGGFIMSRLGRVPKASDYFEWSGMRFEVMDMDRNRVDKVLVSPARSD